MTCQRFETVIGEGENSHSYSYTQLPAKKSLKLKYRLFGILGAAVADLGANIQASEEKQVEAFGAALQHIFAAHDPDEIVALEEQILTPVFRDDERVNIDEMYTGNTMEMYKAIVWVLSKEYGDFFDAASSLFPQLKKTMNG